MKIELEDALIVLVGAVAGGVLFMVLQPLIFAPLQKAITG